MGNYSFIDSDDLELTNVKGFSEWLADQKAPNYVPKKLQNSYFECKNHWLDNWNKANPNFAQFITDSFDDHKIIGYWYEGFCLCLRDLAQFVEGTLSLNYESPDDRVIFTFEKGILSIELGHMVYEKVTVESLGEIPKLSKKELLLRRL